MITNFSKIFCINCLADNVPFSKLNYNEFVTSVKKGVINSCDKVIDFVPSNFQQKIFDNLNAAINNNTFDLDNDDEVMPTIDCKYYSIDDFLLQILVLPGHFLYYITISILLSYILRISVLPLKCLTLHLI